MPVKSNVKIPQNFVALLEYMNFTSIVQKKSNADALTKNFTPFFVFIYLLASLNSLDSGLLYSLQLSNILFISL